PDRLVNAYRGTRVEAELAKLQSRGGAAGGAGAGAAVLAGRVDVRTGDDPRTGPGFGLLPGFVVGRAADDRFAAAVARTPGHAGLAIGDGAAVVVRGRTLRVIGEGTVTAHLTAGAG